MNLQEQARRQDKLTNKYAARLISFVLLGWGTLLFWAYSHFHLSMEELLLTIAIPGSLNMISLFLIYIWVDKGRKEMERRWDQEFKRLEDKLDIEVLILKEMQKNETLRQAFQSPTIPTLSPQKAEELPS